MISGQGTAPDLVGPVVSEPSTNCLLTTTALRQLYTRPRSSSAPRKPLRLSALTGLIGITSPAGVNSTAYVRFPLRPRPWLCI
jgi:hypothetical protein